MKYEEIISMSKEELKLKIKNLILRGQISAFLNTMNSYNELYFKNEFYDGIKDIEFINGELAVKRKNSIERVASKETMLRKLIEDTFKLYDKEKELRRELIEYVENIPNHRMEGFITLEEMGMKREFSLKLSKSINNIMNLREMEDGKKENREKEEIKEILYSEDADEAFM